MFIFSNLFTNKFFIFYIGTLNLKARKNENMYLRDKNITLLSKKSLLVNFK